MRGSPIFNALVVAALLFAALVPLWQLTIGYSNPSSTPRTDASAMIDATSSFVSGKATGKLKSLSLKQGATTLWTIQSAEDLETGEWIDIRLDGDLLEIEISAQWIPGGGVHALEITVEPDGRPARSLTVWSEGDTTSELVSLTWP